MKRKKGQVEKIRPFEGDKEIAQRIADHTGLDLIDIYSLALSAGLHAIADNHYTFANPLTLKVVDAPPLTYPPHVEDLEQIRTEDKPSPPKLPGKRKRISNGFAILLLAAFGAHAQSRSQYTPPASAFIPDAPNNAPSERAFAHPIRQMDGQTIDLRIYKGKQPPPGWRHFTGEVLSVHDDGLLIQTWHRDYNRRRIYGNVISLINYPNHLQCRDNQPIEFFAKEAGTYRYLDVHGANRSVAHYDFGMVSSNLPSPSGRGVGGEGQTGFHSSSTLAYTNPYYGLPAGSVPFEFTGDPSALVQARYVYDSPGAVSYRYRGDPSDLCVSASLRR